MRKIITLLIASVIFSLSVQAKEGMWIPILLEKYNMEEMQQMGFKLTAEDIYSVNQACMKDAVIIFGRGCTGELISDQGLIITNHHCGFDAIQKHSSIENDYLTEGFWAKDRSQELTNDNLSVTFLKRIEDVTGQVLRGVTDDMEGRTDTIQKNIDALIKKATEGTHYKANIKPFFHGNQYFLSVNEVYNDIRLVGAPPSAIGKFGGDTDNWMWPRHTGDFSLFRIYADKDNNPAAYSKDNVPYKPLKHFPISLKGVKEGDFTMVFGYPGTTEEYAPSYHLKMITEKVNPELIDIRTKKLDIIKKYQIKDPAVRIQYASKAASISNSWKRWIGEIKGLDKLNAIDKKENFETHFQRWANENSKQYANLLNEYRASYQTYGDYRLAYSYITEAIFRNGMEAVQTSRNFYQLKNAYKKDTLDLEQIKRIKTDLEKKLTSFYKDYHQPIDKEMTVTILSMFKERIDPQFHPEIYTRINKKYKGNISKFVDHLFAKTIFADPQASLSFAKNFSAKDIKKLEKDPAYILYHSFYDAYKLKILDNYNALSAKIEELNRKYMAAQMKFQPDTTFYPDANFTLRVSYGKVKGYAPKDGVIFKNHTTLNGIIEKDNPNIYDYRVPQKLKDLYEKKDFGQYESQGTVPVCFVATNHTTGGNSGSPVVNANGELIGINFDRAWEGVMSDLMFNPEQCRNITLDIRYVLFLIDKFAGASYLIDEMTLVK
ncbi:S46 family peptidase [Saccharicrinis fermentans]|uniref:Dipeptidyl-peptidase n=1 Tax=Saccharicrinis fermentans DSM 9555 = JCM 21142 TaxID=869213 RepID=W7Y2N7_9BACT|nr:S46 family peptidase [Saccharicrinis fermentans]GAF02242.1 peptidase S46 [Saccharicrinis fermentans DSM 9555 = JCM 21142]